MSFVLGFVCGILAPWMAYRVRKMIKDASIWDEELETMADEVADEVADEIIAEIEEELSND